MTEKTNSQQQADANNLQPTNNAPTSESQETVTITKEELRIITERQDQQIADLVACYHFLQKMQTAREIIQGNPVKAMTDRNKRAQIEEILQGTTRDLAERMKKYEPYVKQNNQDNEQ